MDQNIRDSFQDKLLGLMHAMQRYHIFIHRHASRLQDASRGQGRILALLKMQGNMTTKDLGYLLGIRQQSLNESLKRLESQGYIVRQPDRKDRRIIRINLTDKGKNVKQIKDNNEDVLAGFSNSDLHQFGSYVDRLRKAYEQHLSAEYDPRDVEMADEMEDHMEAMRERMGADHFDEMMRCCRHMGMPMGMGEMHHHWHRHHHCDDC